MAASQCQEGDAERKATAELSRHCHELAGLLSLWREGYADLYGSLWELVQIAGQFPGQGGKLPPSCGEPRTCGTDAGDKALAARPGAPKLDCFREPQEEACPEFTSLAIQLSPPPRKGSSELDAGGTDYVVARRGDSPRGSDAGSSDSFDLDVDEDWSRRIGEMERTRSERERYAEDDEDEENNPVLHSPLFFENFLQSRLMARVAIGDGLRALMDKSWCQVLFRLDEGVGEDEDGDALVEPTRDDSESSEGSSRDSSPDGLWSNDRCLGHGRGHRFPASYRMRGPLGPKEDGPLSKLMDQELLDSE